MIITAGGAEKSRLESIAEDVRTAAHAASVEFGEGGDILTEAENITLKLILGEKPLKRE